MLRLAVLGDPGESFGFEFNGWYGYDPNYRERPTQSWWWVDQDDGMIAFGAIPGYEAVWQYSYERWLPLGQGTIFILERVPSVRNE